MTTNLKVGDRVKICTNFALGCYPNHKADLIGTVQAITDEWIWVNWGLGEIWNHFDADLAKVDAKK